VQQDENAELTILDPRDRDQVEQKAQQADASWTTEYERVVDADIDLLTTACPTCQNADLVIKSPKQGKHSLAVKPSAMDLSEADGIVATMERARVRFMSFDANLHFDPLYMLGRTWLQQQKLGTSVSSLCVQRQSGPIHLGRADAPGGAILSRCRVVAGWSTTSTT
jgi:predicted dehydrogenase